MVRQFNSLFLTVQYFCSILKKREPEYFLFELFVLYSFDSFLSQIERRYKMEKFRYIMHIIFWLSDYWAVRTNDQIPVITITCPDKGNWWFLSQWQHDEKHSTEFNRIYFAKIWIVTSEIKLDRNGPLVDCNSFLKLQLDQDKFKSNIKTLTTCSLWFRPVQSGFSLLSSTTVSIISFRRR